MSPTVAMLILGMILLYTGQGFFNKLFSISHPGKPADVAPMFSVLYGSIVALSTWIFSGFRFAPDATTLILGLLNGVNLFFYNLSSIQAAQHEPYTLQNMLSSFGGILLPMAVALPIWGDVLRPIQWVGIACMLLAFMLYNKGVPGAPKASPRALKWFLLVGLTNGIYGILNDAQQRLETGAHREDMIIIIFLTTALLSALCLLPAKNAGARQAFRMPTKALIFALISSLCATAAINTLMFTLQHVPSSLLYPTEVGGVMVALSLLSMWVLKERIRRHQALGLLLAVAGMVLTNL